MFKITDENDATLFYADAIELDYYARRLRENSKRYRVEVVDRQRNKPCLRFRRPVVYAEARRWLANATSSRLVFCGGGGGDEETYATFSSSLAMTNFQCSFPEATSDATGSKPLFDSDGNLTVGRFFYPASKRERAKTKEDYEEILLSSRGKYLAGASREIWIKVLFVLVNRFKVGDPEIGKKLWLDFSKQCPDKYDENICLKEWENCQPRDGGGLGYGTLVYLACCEPSMCGKKKSKTDMSDIL